MSESIPFVQAYGNVTKALERVQAAATPPRFTQDFLGTKLDLSGGSAKPLIPFLKRLGFLGSDGVPTDLYKKFRNQSERGRAAAAALKTGFRALYEVNEYIHDAADKELKGVVVQVTGSEPTSSTVKGIIGSFKAVRAFATFDDEESSDDAADAAREVASERHDEPATKAGASKIGLSYTINLNLPATSDVAVFDAIFRSLKEHLLK
ncbi:DUF5343 domain-containing protein [Xanthomonas euvesicatoria pv. allii]|uniref:DUF5343 domain-containing protein n=1 Tax=Xanthomonas euvesicatoria TaxID=456327 RepID=UPI002405DAB8|nr:DUF5343 domain-containing protein [Xanthomonas euvesicatoria]MCP3039162.1 DUF5343 domain-containing protein [Xanthomonas euvesicatoria pv. allii]MCP3051069.1 DUF5343 domain-containing protein [Xanthomonas euvesicatoria pv. allii]